MTLAMTLATWQSLTKHFNESKTLNMQTEFKKHPDRVKKFSLQAPEIFLDYSKNLITEKTLELLCQLAQEAKLEKAVQQMFSGKKINVTEHRPVLHTALRQPKGATVLVDGENIIPKIHAVLDKMSAFVSRVRSGEWKGFTNKPITDIVNIGIGGSDLGPKMVCEALKHYADQLRTHFISNIDGTQIVETLKHLNPETTLFIVASKTFTTLETLTNAQTAKSWLIKALKSEKSVSKHFVAVSTNVKKVKAFGIDTNNMFEFWDWVGGRYSVWSAIGLSIALSIGMDGFLEFLGGAHEMDEHFRTAPFEKNLPVLLALIGIWYRNFYALCSQAVIPYNDYLKYFTAYLQQMDMESNGKSITKNGKAVDYKTGPVIWGGIGTDCQHSFHQLLHQGTDVIPVDFIISLYSLNPVGEHQHLLFANCLAQAQALLQGKIEQQAPYKVMPGNRPSNMLVLNKLTPKSLGALLAAYEHKVFAQGIIWGLNSFDQWGVELGKQLATQIGSYLKEDAVPKNMDDSTKQLIERYKKS